MLFVMLLITALLAFFLIWCPLLTFLVSLIPIDRLQYYIAYELDTYVDSIGFGIELSCVLAFVLGWIWVGYNWLVG